MATTWLEQAEDAVSEDDLRALQEVLKSPPSDSDPQDVADASDVIDRRLQAFLPWGGDKTPQS